LPVPRLYFLPFLFSRLHPHPRLPLLPQLVDRMAEGLGKKPKDVMSGMGLETDEEAGASIKDFVVA
jgi:hypothetical protein